MFLRRAFVVSLLAFAACTPSVVSTGTDGSSPSPGEDAATLCTRTSCGADCVDLKADPKNCGACGIACGSGKACVDGVCQCGAQGSTTECPSGQICDVPPTGAANLCLRTCALASRGCPSNAACAPVNDSTGSYSGFNDCFPDVSGKAAGAPCTGNDCRADLTCIATAAGKICAGYCVVGGTVTCVAGETCTDLGRGKNLGYCKPSPTCVAGAPCAFSNPCHSGTTQCQAGLPVCVDGAANQTDGTACGMDKICVSGICTGCVSNSACQAANVCHAGKTQCGAGGITCVDTGLAANEGGSCGGSQLCLGGVCVSRVDGGTTLPADAASAGADAASAGADAASAGADAAAAGADAASTCVPNVACTPSGAGTECRTGTTSCAGGIESCVAGGNLANGTVCGANKVCSNGACNTCLTGVDCTPAGACKVSKTSCTTGASQCLATSANVADGTSCGTGRFCNAGSCVTCTSNTACAPSTGPCHVGVTSCSTGGQSCVDTGVLQATGSDCTPSGGPPSVCSSTGACNACTANTTCVPASNECKVGVTSCASGSQVCSATSVNVSDGAACTGGVCQAGACVRARTFAVLIGANQSGTIDAALSPITAQLTDSAGAVANVTVTIASPSGATSTPPTVVTDSAGKFTFIPRVGRAAADYTFTLKAPGATPLPVKTTAVAPADGTLFTVVNVDHSTGDEIIAASGAASHINAIGGFKFAADGTIYFADTNLNRIRKLTPSGELINVAGTGACGALVDNIPALTAAICGPFDLALDEPNGVMYFSEPNYNRIRMVDLGTNIVTTVTGTNGSAPAPTYGDGGPAASALVAGPKYLTLVPGNLLLVSDNGHERIRAINTQTGIINPWLNRPVVPSDSNPVTLALSRLGYSGQTVIDPGGNTWVSGYFIGSAVNAPCTNYQFVTNQCGGVPAVVRRATNGTLTAFAGSQGGATVAGTHGSKYAFAEPPPFTIDPAGNLYFAETSRHRLTWLDAGNGRVQILLGTGTAGYAGDYVPSSSTAIQVSGPSFLNFDSQRGLYLVDSGNFALREVFHGGAATKTLSKLTLVSGNNLSTRVDDLAPGQFRVKLTDAADVPLVNFDVAWSVVDPGGGLYSSVTSTDAAGVARVLARGGLSLGTWRFLASFNDPYGQPVPTGPLTFTLTTTAAGTGDLFTIVNADHSAGDDRVPGSAVLAHVGQFGGFKQVSDGTIYFADTNLNRIRKLSPSGELTNFVGNGGCAFVGDNGPAIDAGICGPTDLAVDQVNGVLYLTEPNYNRIRAVDLATNIITTITGTNNTAPGPTFGDGGPASSALVATPKYLTIAPGNLLLVSDNAHERIRAINTQTGIINSWMSRPVVPSDNTPITLAFLRLGYGGQVVIDSSGNPWVSAYYVGSSVNAPCTNYQFVTNQCGGVPAVVGPGGAKAGSSPSYACGATTCTASTQPNAAANNFYFAAAPLIALDAANALYVGETGRNWVLKLDSTNKLQLVAGTGVAGYSGDYSAPSLALLNAPQFIAITKTGRLTISDTGNNCVRQIYQP